MMDGQTRWRFLVDAHVGSDTLIRVLTPFAVQGAELCDVTLTRTARGLSISLEVEGLGHGRAELLLRRLEALPVVRHVGLGWRSTKAVA
jgi:hypothetical protein